MNSIKKTLALAAISLFSLGAGASNVIGNGLSDFGSDYDYTANANPYAPGTIKLGSNPHDFHSSWASFSSFSGGNMLIVNGGESLANNVVWSKEISLSANTRYDFSAAAASAYDENRATLQAVLTFNDSDHVLHTVQLGTVQLGAAGAWQSWSGSLVSDFSGDAQLKLLNLTTAYNGNDFAIDRLSLTSNVTAAVPEPQSYALMLAGLAAMGFVARRRQKR